MIQKDEKGNPFLTMADGQKVPVKTANVKIDHSITINVTGVVVDAHGTPAPVPIADALAEYQTAADYWFRKAERLQTELADLKARQSSGG